MRLRNFLLACVLCAQAALAFGQESCSGPGQITYWWQGSGSSISGLYYVGRAESSSPGGACEALRADWGFYSAAIEDRYFEEYGKDIPLCRLMPEKPEGPVPPTGGFWLQILGCMATNGGGGGTGGPPQVRIEAPSVVKAGSVTDVFAQVTSAQGVPVMPNPSMALALQPVSGSLTSCSAVPNAVGRLKCSYKAPRRATKDNLTAACATCTNTAQAIITVTKPLTCEADGTSAGNPILPASGEKIQVESDYNGPEVHDMNFVRRYSSGWALNGASRTSLPATLGKAWIHSHESSLIVGPSVATATLGDGTVHHFTLNAGVWQPEDIRDSLTPQSNGWQMRIGRDESTWSFDADGKLTAHVMRNGWTRSYGYSTSGTAPEIAPRAGLLISVTNHFGRTELLSYDSAARLARVQFPDGQSMAYSYDAGDRLILATHSDGSSKRYFYEDVRFPHVLTGVQDENGNRYATFQYDAQGRGTVTEHAGGANRYEIAYSGQVDGPATVTDPLGMARTYSYGAADGRILVTGSNAPPAGANSSTANRTPSPEGLVTSETDFLGVQTIYTWDTARKLPLAVTRAANRPEAQTTSTEWHPSFRLPLIVTEAGKTTAYTYDDAGNVAQRRVTDTASGAVRTWSYVWNNGLMAASTDPLGRQTQYAYTGGNLTQVTNPAGHVTSLAYDAAGRLSNITQPTGLQVSYTYDARGRILTRTMTPSGGGTSEVDSFLWKPSGQLAKATAASGLVLTYTYDEAQRLTDVEDSFGNKVTYTLDGMGNQVTTVVVDALGNSAMELGEPRNILNRVRHISNGMGATQFGYDANGDLTSTKDLGGQETYSLDGLGRVVGQTLKDGAATSLTYNALDQQVAATDAKGVQTAYAVNALGNVSTESSPDTGGTSFTYDLAGNVLSRTDAKGQATQYQWDAIDRLTRITYADNQQSVFTYDANARAIGKLSRVQDPEGTTDFTYDGLGRMASKTQALKNGMTHTVQYTYAPGGQIASITYPSGKVVTYQQTAGRITGISVNGQPFVSGLTYTGLNQPKGWSWASGDVAAREFDSAGRMTSTEFATYRYDEVQRIRAITQRLYLPTATPDGSTTTTPSFTLVDGYIGILYDARNRITQFERSLDQNPSVSLTDLFTYDANGNRLTSVQELRNRRPNGRSGQMITTSRSWQIDQASNRLLGFNQQIVQTNPRGSVLASVTLNVPYVLDANGNPKGDGLKDYEYDADDRLAKVTTGLADARKSTTYLHNGLGERVFKSDPVAELAAPDPQTNSTGFLEWLQSHFAWLFGTTQNNDRTKLGVAFVYDGGPELLGEYGGGGNRSTGSTEYIYLPTAQGKTLVGAAINGELYAVHTDHLNTPRRMTDATNQPVWQWSYSAFGENEPAVAARNFKDRTWSFSASDLKDLQDGVDDADNGPQFGKKMVKLNVRFPGQYFDDESNLHYNYFRTYAPSTGRYSQPDPIGLDGGLNRFAYVDGNPMNVVDPEGLAPTKAVIWLVKICKTGIQRIRPVSKEEAVRLAKQGKDLETNRSTAKKIADAASDGKDRIKDRAHRNKETGSLEGRKPHYHPNPRNGSHIFYSAASALTLAGNVDCDDCTLGYIAEGLDLLNPLSLPKDLMDLTGVGVPD